MPYNFLFKSLIRLDDWGILTLGTLFLSKAWSGMSFNSRWSYPEQSTLIFWWSSSRCCDGNDPTAPSIFSSIPPCLAMDFRYCFLTSIGNDPLYTSWSTTSTVSHKPCSRILPIRTLQPSESRECFPPKPHIYFNWALLFQWIRREPAEIDEKA